MIIKLLYVFLLINFSLIQIPAQIIYADANQTDDLADGLSWENAKKYLQSALAIASSGNDIYVAQGLYYPDEGTGQFDNTNNSTFQMIEGVNLYGGYPTGGGERDAAAFATILNGDLDQSGTKNGVDAANVVRGANSALIDGFTITNGYANSSTIFNGGGMYNINVSPTVNNCKFISNTSYYSGGGIFSDGSNPTIANCRFENNTTIYQGSGAGLYLKNTDEEISITNCSFISNTASAHGGGLFIEGGDWVTILNCIFEDNTSNGYGGGVWCYLAKPRLIKCSFIENSSESGGAVHLSGIDAELINCVFLNNSASVMGGAIYHEGCNIATITHCSFYGNLAGGDGDGIRSNSNFAVWAPEITNSIFWGSENQIIHWNGINVSYSDVQMASGTTYPGTDNINSDPAFFSSTDLHLTSSSNCLGVASDLGITVDRDGNIRPKPVGTNPDMGAYEYAPIILPDLTVFLEGPYNAGQLLTNINPTLPLNQPYNASPWNYNGEESVIAIPENVVDWILVELRSESLPSSMVARKALFLKNDGSIVELDANNSVEFDDVESGDYYIVVFHRNHLPIMSASKIAIQ